MSQPNILLLTLDTLRADALGCYGSPAGVTPNMDRIAAAGVRFEQAITGGSWTQAAFPVMLTSTYAAMHGGCLGPLSPSRPSPVEALSDAGYRTGAFSTSPLLSRAYGYDRGFQHFADLTPAEGDPSLRKLKGGERLLRSPLTHRVSGLFGRTLRPARLYISADDLVGQLLGWIGEADRPFFGWAHFMDIHWPYHLEETLRTPAQIAQAWRDLSHLYRVNWQNGTISPAQREYYVRLYQEAVRYTDVQLGRLLNSLETMNLLDDTIIILVSDHGEEFLERGRWGHFEDNLHDEILHVPLLLHAPEIIQEPLSVSQQVSLLDLMPTILDLAGCPVPGDGMLGKSLRPLWEGKANGAEPEFALSEMWRDPWHIVALRTRDYKFIWNSRELAHPRLYDLHQDPGERDNLRDGRPGLVQEFQEQVNRHLKIVAQSAPGAPVAALEHDAEVIRRLRDLGYLD